MRYFMTASHGPLAGAILRSAEFIGGKDLTSRVHVIEVQMEDSAESIHRRIGEIFSHLEENDEMVAMTDVFGGNVTNILTEYLDKNLFIITGMNLAMVLEALLSDPAEETENLVDRLCQSGCEGVKCVNKLLGKKDEEEEI